MSTTIIILPSPVLLPSSLHSVYVFSFQFDKTHWIITPLRLAVIAGAFAFLSHAFSTSIANAACTLGSKQSAGSLVFILFFHSLSLFFNASRWSPPSWARASTHLTSVVSLYLVTDEMRRMCNLSCSKVPVSRAHMLVTWWMRLTINQLMNCRNVNSIHRTRNKMRTNDDEDTVCTVSLSVSLDTWPFIQHDKQANSLHR